MNEEQLNDFRINLKTNDKCLVKNSAGVFYERIFNDYVSKKYIITIHDIEWMQCYLRPPNTESHDPSGMAWPLKDVYPIDFLLKSKLTKKGKELEDLYDNL
jgi:hypothetical protein